MSNRYPTSDTTKLDLHCPYGDRVMVEKTGERVTMLVIFLPQGQLVLGQLVTKAELKERYEPQPHSSQIGGPRATQAPTRG